MTHEMRLVRTHPSGADEWYCPTCGRRFLMHWPPNYRKVVLEPDDETAAHAGGKGSGLVFRGLAVRQEPAREFSEDAAERPDTSDPDDPEGLLAKWREL